MVSKLLRRDFCKNVALATLLAPVLRLHKSQAMAQHPGSASPTRCIFFFTPNGPVMVEGPGKGTESNFQLHEFWRPLNRHKSDGIFLSHMKHAGLPYGKSDYSCAHTPPKHSALTGTTSEGTGAALGPSIDQFIGQHLQKAGHVSPHRSLLWGLDPTGDGPWYESAGKAIPPVIDPFLAFDRLVKDFMGGSREGNASMRLKQQKSILDSVHGDCKSLQSLLGQEGKELLEFHCTSIRSMELSVSKSLNSINTNSCTVPQGLPIKLPRNANWRNPENYDEMVSAFVELMVLAFQCELTRTIGFSIAGAGARFSLPSKYGIPSAAKVDSGDSGPQHHAWSHSYEKTPEKYRALMGFYNWYSEVVARTVDRLKAVPDAHGKPLFNSTLVLWVPEMGGWDGSDHPHLLNDLPVVLMGSSNGKLNTGRLLHGKNDSRNMHALYVSIIHHMGLTGVNHFGNPGGGSGPLQALYR